MKTPSNTLFLLIHKMTPSEKRYFKRFGLVQQKKDTNKYILLFDAINKQPHYDETALLQQFEAYNFVNNFSEIKKYLLKQIKKALRNYHSENSIESILYKYLTDINILYQKELYQECHKTIKRATKIAQQYEHLTVLLLLNEWKRKVLCIGHHLVEMQKYLANNLLEDKKNINLLQQEIAYYEESTKVSILFRQKGHGNKPKPFKITELPTPITFKAKRYACLKKGIEAYLNADGAGILDAATKNIKIFETNPHFINAHPKEYVIAISNMINYCASRLEYNHLFDKYMEKALNTLKKPCFDKEFRIKEKLWIYINQTKAYSYKGCPNELKQSRKCLEEHYTVVQNCNYSTPILDIHVQTNLLRSALVLEDFSAMLQAYNNFLSLNLGNYREDLQIENRLLGLIPHYKLGNWLLLKSMIRSIIRLINTKHTYYKIGAVFVKAIKQCVLFEQQKDKTSTLATLKQLKKDILAVADKKQLIAYILFIAWIENETNRVSIVDYVHEVVEPQYSVTA